MPGYSTPIYDESVNNMSCSIIAFLDSSDYESAIRLAISLGGDSDTIACMAGGIAAAYYGIPSSIDERARTYLPDDMLAIVDEFDRRV